MNNNYIDLNFYLVKCLMMYLPKVDICIFAMKYYEVQFLVNVIY